MSTRDPVIVRQIFTRGQRLASRRNRVTAGAWFDHRAPGAIQLAVLLHDIERLASEPDARIEHLAADYQAFKDAHARAGARIARTLLGRAGVASALVAYSPARMSARARHELPALRMPQIVRHELARLHRDHRA